MRDRAWPTFARPRHWHLAVVAHSRGRPGAAHSPFERAPGARWAGTVSLPPLALDEALNLRGFLHLLRGRAGTFFLPLPEPDTASGTLGAAVSAGADTLTLAGFTAAFAAAGRWLLVGTYPAAQLLQIVTSAPAGANFTLTVRPRLRAAYASGTAASIGRVSGLFRLARGTPPLPLRVSHADPLDIDIEEAV